MEAPLTVLFLVVVAACVATLVAAGGASANVRLNNISPSLPLPSSFHYSWCAAVPDPILARVCSACCWLFRLSSSLLR
jgi:hypothetical protein